MSGQRQVNVRSTSGVRQSGQRQVNVKSQSELDFGGRETCCLYVYSNTNITLFFCREEYARQFGFMGEQLVEELGKGHHSGDVANLPPQFSSQPQYSRNVRQKRKLRKTQGSILLDLALSVFRTD